MVQLFQLIAKSIGAKRVIEVGTFTGYTSLSLAQVLPDDGEVYTLDCDDSLVAYDIWNEAGQAKKVSIN